jgi:hypothetical protein
MIKTEHIFLFGHRKQHGKDTCANLLEGIVKERNISYKRTFFAKELKKVSAMKYNLDYDKMDDNSYKMSKPAHLKGLTVREVLIREGLDARSIWIQAWANIAFGEIFRSEAKVGIISDFRFPNEHDGFDEILKSYVDLDPKNNKYISKPKIYKILVHRPNGIFSNDGADDQVPDDVTYWDHVILNDDDTESWKHNLSDQLVKIVNKIL